LWCLEGDGVAWTPCICNGTFYNTGILTIFGS
jgi:hypothetical protein